MRGLMLLGLAMVNGVGEFASAHRAFVAEHLEEVTVAIKNSARSRGRLGGFRKELLALGKIVDEATRVAVIDPWCEAVEKARP
jgi:hypothetical protein